MTLPRISDHELICRIGQGAYGEVWLARHTTLGAMRAVKLVFRKEFDDERPYQREFDGLLKFEPISRSHPSQLAILHVGRDDVAGCFYYVMELGDPVENTKAVSNMNPRQGRDRKTGESPENGEPGSFGVGLATDPPLLPLGSYIPRTVRSELKARGRLSASEAIELGRALATALEHLHSHGLVHRDIKPANIVYVGGVPKLADIGLITDASDACSIVGTEGYIPPEGPGTPQADVYSLGKVLYESATGKDRRDYPALPDDVRDWQDAKPVTELNAVILRACARDPRDRYSSAAAMRADLERLQAGDSVRQRHARQQLWGHFKRAALLVGIIAAVIGLTVRMRHPPPPDYGEGKPSANPEAERLFGMGRRAYEKRTQLGVQTAIQCFEDALQADTNFAKAYAWLAAAQSWSYAGTNRNFEFLPLAKTNALRALSLDPHLAKAHASLAWHAFCQEWDPQAAEEHFRVASQYAPRDAEIYEWHGAMLNCLGRTNEAIANLQTAIRLKSDSVSAWFFLACAYDVARDYDKAITSYNTAIKMEPGGTLMTYSGLVQTLRNAGRFEDAIKEEERWNIREIGGEKKNAIERANALRWAYDTKGRLGYWQQLLDWEEANPSSWNLYDRAALHARVGHSPEALTLLEQAEREHNYELIQNVKVDPALDSLQEDHRFKSLLKRLKLDQ